MQGITIEMCSCVELFDNPEFMQEAVEYSKVSVNNSLEFKSFDRDYYENAERMGIMKWCKVTEQEKLIGFSSIILVKYPHYNKTIATLETIYLNKSYRKNNLGLKLINFMRAVAKENGADGMFLGAPFGSKLENFYKRKYTPVNTLFYTEV